MARGTDEPLLSRGALALNPLALGAAQGDARGDANVRLELRFDPGGIAPSDRELLEPFGPLAGGRIRCAPSELAARAERSPAASLFWRAAEAFLRPPEPPRLMGVVNVTPDSFSDGGAFLDPARAVEHGLRLVEAGAALLDVGAESTRPGADPVPLDAELSRAIPVVAGLARRARVPISIDTRKSTVARAALDAGAAIVNDVSAGRADPEMLPLVSARRCGLVLMHMQGTPGDMQQDPRYGDVVGEVARFLRERAAACVEQGIPPAALWIDPGIGFGKDLGHNLELLRNLPALRSLGLRLLVGVSRKSFIARIERRLGARESAAHERLGGTAAAVAACVRGGAEVLRVHDVAVMAQAARVAWALAARE